jgi:hypothetical protein
MLVGLLAFGSQPAIPASLQFGLGSVGQPAENAMAERLEEGALPGGTRLYLRLDKAVSTKSSHLRDAVTAHIVRETPGRGPRIPIGAVAGGSIEKLIPSSTPDDRARVLLLFRTLQIPSQPPLSLAAHLVEVENARENVLADGTIQGVLQSELPVSRLESILAKAGPNAGELQKIMEKALGKSDTSIEYPAGPDLVLVLDKPLNMNHPLPSAAPEQLSAPARAAVDSTLADAPQRSQTREGQPADPLNLVVIGGIDEIRQTFLEAGWIGAVKKTDKSIWDTVRAVIDDQGYGSAPVSDLYLFGRSEDLAYEKMLNTFMKRHHLRLWRSQARTPDGREIWLGAATHDVGLDVHPGVISHAIDPDLDAERAKVGADVLVTGRVAAEQFVARSKPLTSGMTATGGEWKTDGRLLGIELRAP